MNPEQIKDAIRKLNWCDRIGLYRWINEEIAGRPGIGVDRSPSSETRCRFVKNNGCWQICHRVNSNQDNEPLSKIAYDGQPGVLNPLALDGTLSVMRTFTWLLV
jgi:hypothetical protein